ncbi:transposase [Cupriavidus consociatus]|uniref:transposase n=1 Tax=Cupriavidus consociatus TaxID=2821357 RepID=UPI001FD7DC62|nr:MULTISPECIES: transposase [unclassified Cupriavidus]MDK2662207.1 transposase [Cupriavidus sp. LEh21]
MNQIWGLLGEYGLHFVVGRKAAMARLSEIEQTIPAPLWRLLSHQLQRLRELDAEILAAEQEIAAWLKAEPAAQCVDAIPRIGPITATALVATMGSPQACCSGRAFAASLGLVPTQSSTGGKVSPFGERPNAYNATTYGPDLYSYLRMLLVHGARAVVQQAPNRHDALSCWINELRSRRGMNIAVVALANKTARTIWVLLAKEQDYATA